MQIFFMTLTSHRADMMYLIFNLLKSLWAFSSLSYIDRVVVFLTMDASSATLSMTLCERECLAARINVLLCLVCQFLSFLVQSTGLIGSIMQWSTCGTCCYKQVWWTSLADYNCRAGALWAYTGLRILLWIDTSWVSYSYSSSFDKRRKGITAEPLDEDFVDIPATAFDHYAFELTPLVVNALSHGFAISNMSLENESKWTDWGQSAQLVACVYGLCHWFYIIAQITPDQLTLHTDTKFGRTALTICRTFHRSLQCLSKTTHWLRLWTQSAGPPTDGSADDPLELIPSDQFNKADESLRVSVILGDVTGVTEAIKRGASVNSTRMTDHKGMTRLCLAIKNDQLEVLQFLLQQRAVPCFWNDKERQTFQHSALHYAAELGKADAISILIPRYVQSPDVYDAASNTLLIYAVATAND